MAHAVRRHYAVVDGRYKLIHFYEEDLDEWELYNLERDPYELTSVYEHPKYRDVQQRLHQELARLRKESQVPEEDPEASRRGGPQRYQEAIEAARERLRRYESERPR